MRAPSHSVKLKTLPTRALILSLIAAILTGPA
jgi:hypothetical protein